MTCLLVDGNNVLARATFAAKGGRTEMAVDGVNTSALLIFINMLSKYVRATKPDRLLVCWDAGHMLRKAIYPAYKIKRTQPPEVEVEHDEARTPREQAREFCTWAGVPQVTRSGWEADDLLAVFHASTPGPKVILSGDKDLLQLVDFETTQIRPGGTGVSEHWDVARVEQELGCTPDRLPLLMALTGDPGDGVPGVRGIGPKKAVKALAEVGWDWEAALGLLGPERAAEAVLSRRLVDLRNTEFAAYAEDVLMLVHKPRPVPEFVPSQPGTTLWEPLVAFLDKWRMSTVTQRLRDGVLWQDDPLEPTPEGAQQMFSGFDS